MFVSEKINITVFVVGYNESYFLEKCLHSVKEFDEILYFDLQSTDDSVEIAKKYTDKIYIIPKEEFVEIVHYKYIDKASNDWVMILDPDEVVDNELYSYLEENFYNIIQNPIYGAIQVPWKFYFKNVKLKGTPWGYCNSKYLLVNKQKFEFKPIIHQGRKIKNGFNIYKINDEKNRIVHHYWMSSITSLVNKHLRYLKREGESKYDFGLKTSLVKIIFTPFTQFYYSYISREGYKDMFLGFMLSLFWAWYQTNAQIQLMKYTIRKSRNDK